MPEHAQLVADTQPIDQMDARPRKNFYLILSAMAISSAGDWLFRLALPIAVLQLTGSAGNTAITYILEYVPYIFLGPLAGAVSDKSNRRLLLVTTQLFSAIMAGLLGLFILNSFVSFAIFLIMGVILASSQVFFQPTLQGLIQTSIPDSQLPSMNAKIQMTNSIFNTLGPAFGAAITTFIGVSGSVLLDAASFFLAALILFFVSVPSMQKKAATIEKTNLFASISESFRYLRANPSLLSGVLLMGGANFGLMVIEANLIYVTVDMLGVSNVFTGVVLGFGGIGAILGASLATRIVGRFKTGPLIVSSMLLSGIATVLMFMKSWAYLAVLWAIVCVMVSVIVVAWMTFQQRAVARDMMGRVAATGRTMSFISIPLGAFAGGYLIEHFNSLPYLALLGGGVQILIALWARFSPLWKAQSKEA